jgi:heme/copper-type cytochrome/quinol oxidase subunit 2
VVGAGQGWEEMIKRKQAKQVASKKQKKKEEKKRHVIFASWMSIILMLSSIVVGCCCVSIKRRRRQQQQRTNEVEAQRKQEVELLVFGPCRVLWSPRSLLCFCVVCSAVPFPGLILALPLSLSLW